MDTGLTVVRRPVEPGRPARAGTVVFAHGLGESAQTLLPLVPVHHAAGWDLVLPDLRGHGASPRFTAQELLDRHPGDAMADDLLAVIDACPTGPLVVMGHSAGAAIAAGAAAARRDRIAGVLLEDPFWRVPVTRDQDPAVAREGVLELLVQQRRTDEDRQALQRALTPNWPAVELAAWSRARACTDPAIVAHGGLIPSAPWPELIRSITGAGVPVLVVTGTDRVGMTPAHRQLIIGAGAAVEIIHGATHFVRRTRPLAFSEVVAGFLQLVTDRQSR